MNVLAGAALKSSLNRTDVVGAVYRIPLSCIVINDNPRQEPESLVRLGYTLVDCEKPSMSLLHMALDEDLDRVKVFVNLIELHEGEPKEEEGDIPQKIRSGREGTPILTLARSIQDLGQLQPTIVRKAKGSQRHLIFGQRRLVALAYLHAKSRLEAAKDKSHKVFPPFIEAKEIKADDDMAWELGVQENQSRKANTAFQEAYIFHQYLQKTRPDGKKWTLKSVAKHLGMDPGSVRNRHALLLERQEPVIVDGKVISSGRGLTNEDRDAILTNKKTLTWGFRRALGLNYYTASGERLSRRVSAITLKEMQRKFDETPLRRKERRKAIAECMGLSFDVATEQSIARLSAHDRTDVRRRHREAKPDDSDVEF